MPLADDMIGEFKCGQVNPARMQEARNYVVDSFSGQAKGLQVAESQMLRDNYSRIYTLLNQDSKPDVVTLCVKIKTCFAFSFFSPNFKNSLF